MVTKIDDSEAMMWPKSDDVVKLMSETQFLANQSHSKAPPHLLEVILMMW